MRGSVLIGAGAAVASLVVGLAAGVPAQAAAADPHCGDTLTHNASLHHNLTCTTDVGLTLGPGVTLDLNGHALIGTDGNGTGILASPTGQVLIRHGRISQWNIGIGTTLPGADDPAPAHNGIVTIRRIAFGHDGVGVNTNAGQPGGHAVTTFRITRSLFQHNGSGVAGTVSDTRVSRSTFRYNSYGVRLDTSTGAIASSRITHNETGVQCTESSCTLKHDVLGKNTTGIATDTFGRLSLAYSKFTSNHVALDSTDYRLNIRRNSFSHNHTALNLTASQGTIARNKFAHNGLALTASDAGVGVPLTLYRNRFGRNGNAIVIDDATDVTVQANVARHNKHHGIYAPNATDGGGNHASHNGTLPNCVGVSCTA